METERTITSKTQGRQHGFIRRMFSPHDLGLLLKPFVFLDFLDGDLPKGFGFGYHPHSGIATLTYQLNADVAYTDTEGKEGILEATGLEWMQAGGGAWHKGTILGEGTVNGFQLWIALPPDQEEGPSFSQYIAPHLVPQTGNVRVLLGDYEDKHSLIASPSPINYCDVSVARGKKFQYKIPPDHTVAWAFVYQGSALLCGEEVSQALVAFGPKGDTIGIKGLTDSKLLIGTAAEHRFDIITGYSSVHTNKLALKKSEERIAIIGEELKKAGKLED